MIVEYIRYTIDAPRAPSFLAAYETAAQSLRASDHCLGYELSQCTEDRESFILRIHWDSADGHLKGFRASPEFKAFFAAIQPFVKDISEMRHYERTSVARSVEGDIRMADAPVPTLLEWMGGPAALERLLSTFYAKVPEDPLIGPVFAGMSPDHVQHVAAFVGEVFGGDQVYSREHGGHPHMIRRHAGRTLTEKHRARWVQMLLECADEVGLPSDPEFRSAFVAYLEWGTRLAVINSEPNADINADAPMPKWGWGEVKGPYMG